MTHLVLLDDFHLDDLLFLDALGRLMAGARRRVVLVHGSGGQAERLLEADGRFPEARHGAFPGATGPERALIEAGVRRMNRTIVGTLTDAMVPAVGFHGGDRGLLRLQHGTLEAGRVQGLQTLVEQGAVPVVSSLVSSPDASVLVPPGDALHALAAAWPAPAEAVVFTRDDRPALDGESERAGDALAGCSDILSDAYAAHRVAEARTPLRVTSPAGLFGEAGPAGTRFVTRKAE